MMRATLAGAAALVLATALTTSAATVSGVVRSGGRPTPDAVVYLERVGEPLPHPPPARVVMDQKNLSFGPHVLPVVQGTTIEFTNSDDIQHNVFSPSHPSGAFDLGTYSRGQSRTVVMRELGEAVVLCNIHMEMEAHILVVRDPFFAVTERDGSYRIPDVPPGRYTVKVWRSKWLRLERTLEVTDAPTPSLDVDL